MMMVQAKVLKYKELIGMQAELVENMKYILVFVLIVSFTVSENQVFSQQNQVNPKSGFLVFSGGLSTLVYSDIGDPFRGESFLYDSKTGVYGNNTAYSIGFQQYPIENLGYKLTFQRVKFGRSDTRRSDNSESSNLYKFETKLNQLEARLQYDFYHFDFLTYNAFYGFLGVGYLFGNSQITEFVNNGNPQEKAINSTYIPFGIGYSLNLGNRISIGGEADINYMFSDFIDGKKPNEGSTWGYDIAASFKLVFTYKIFNKIEFSQKDKYQWK